MTRPHIGLAVARRDRTARSMTEAFGPYARLDTEPSKSFLDRVIGVACAAITIAAAGMLAWNFWGTV